MKREVSPQSLMDQLPFVLDKSDFSFLGEKYEGKVRDNYVRGDKRFLITSDRLSCFDRVVTTVPFKGQVLTQLAARWFKLSEHIVSNHLIDIPDPNVMVGRNCQVLPVEVVIRAYLTGSAWRDYEAGRAISGVTLPAGLKANQKLPEVIITPSTKAEKGAHDLPISEPEILQKGLLSAKLWDQIKEVTFALFALGQTEAGARGLMLVDTKYEFGLADGKLFLVDEIHTLDSSRYWVAGTYQQRFAAGENPEMLDKEPTRQWLLRQGYKGDGPIPEFTAQHRCEIAQHYISTFERITGVSFEGKVGSVTERIERNLRKYLAMV